MQFLIISGWGLLLLVAVGGPSPFLAEGPGGISPPFLARVHWWWWWVVPRQSLVGALGAVPRDSSLRSAFGGGGVARVGLAWVLLRVCLWCAVSVVLCCGVCAFLGLFCGAMGFWLGSGVRKSHCHVFLGGLDPG